MRRLPLALTFCLLGTLAGAGQEYMDPLAWRHELRFGPGLPGSGMLRNVPYRDKQSTLPV